MASAVATIVARLVAGFAPQTATTMFVIGLGTLLAFGVFAIAVLLLFASIALGVGRRTSFRQPITVAVGDQSFTFDEMRFVPLLVMIGSAVLSAFQLFFATAIATAKGVVQFILLNLRQFLAILVLLGFIAVYLSVGTIIYPVTTQAWNCEIGPPLRTTILPPAAFTAFALANALPVQNFVSRFTKTATTSAIFRAVIGSFQAVSVSLMLFGSALLQFNVAQKNWLMQPTPPGQVSQFLVVSPDFNETAHLVGDAIFNLRSVTNVACAPLQPYVFEPLLAPFDREEFAAALNNTLNLLYVPWSQGVLRPIGQYLVNLKADPGGSFGEIAPLPSFNSTIDTLNNAQRNWTRFGDSFIPSIIDGINVLLRDVTGVPLPPTQFPTRGPLTILLSSWIDILLRIAKLTQNLAFQLIFNPDVALSYPDGIAIWKIDEILDGILEYTGVITDYTTFIADYLRDLGQEFENELTNPLSLTAEHHRALVLASGEYTTLATEGEIVNDALQFVADLVDRVPCIVIKTAEAIVSILKLANDLIVGTIYTFLHSAFAGRVASPFAHAQTLFRRAPLENIQCKVQSTVLFTVPVLDPCPDRVDAAAACIKPLFNPSTMQYEFQSPVYSTWITAPQSTINSVGSSCAMLTCTGSLVFAVNNTNIPPSTEVNRYTETLDKIQEPLICIFDFIAHLCVGNLCPFSTSTAITIQPQLRSILLLPINLIVHFDKVVSTAYVSRDVCFPVVNQGWASLHIIEIEITNAVRRILNAIISVAPITPCGFATTASAPTSSFVPCCVLNAIDAVFGFTVEILRQLTVQTQSLLRAFLPAANGGQGKSSYTPPTFFINTGWITTGANSLACLPVQLVPPTLPCNGTMATVRATAQSTLGIIAFEILVFLPRLVVNTFNGLLNLILQPSAAAFRNMLIGILSPIVQSIGNIMLQLAVMLQCVDSTNAFTTVMLAIATFIITSLNLVLPVIVDLGVASFQFITGIFALFTGDTSIFFMAISSFFTLVQTNVDTIVKAFAGILISLLSQSFICSVTEAVCSVTPFDNTPFVQACNEGLGTNPPNDFGFFFCNNRKRAEFATRDCFQYLADFGYARAAHLAGAGRLPDSSGDDERARDCYERVNAPGALMEYLMHQQKGQNLFFSALRDAPRMIQEHWERESAAADERVEQLYNEQLHHARTNRIDATTTHQDEPVRYEIDFGLFTTALVDRFHGDKTAALRFEQNFLGHHAAAHERAKRSVARFPRHESGFVNLAVLFRHLRNIDWPTFHWSNNATATAVVAIHEEHKRALPSRSREMTSVAVGLHIARDRIARGFNHASERLRSWARGKLDIAMAPKLRQSESPAVIAARKYDSGQFSATSISYVDARGHRSLASWYASRDLVAPLAVNIDPGLLPVIGLPDCDEMTQFVCTDCKYVDDLLLVSQRSFEAAQRFYNVSSTERGTFGYLAAQLDRTLTDVLVDPGGNDTYTTEPRSTLFFTTRLWESRFWFQWDRTELLDILLNTPVSCDLTDPFADLDIDQGLIDAFNTLLGDLVPFAQQVACRVVVAPAEVATRVFERYVQCDYDEALYGVGNKGSASIDGPQQLLDGAINSAFTLALVGSVVELIPGTAMTFMVIAPPWMYFGTLWLGYGSSFLCTIPGPFQMFGAYPVTLPLDAYALLESLLAPSLPYPLALIDPAERAHFSTVKITTCGDVPTNIDCSVYGFDSVYDNIFFTTGVLLGGDFNANAATAVGLLSDSAQASALEWTDARIAELEAQHNAGDVCNRQTFVAIFLGIIALTAQLFIGLSLNALLLPAILFIGAVCFLILLMLNEAMGQIDEHYIEDRQLDTPPPPASET